MHHLPRKLDFGRDGHPPMRSPISRGVRVEHADGEGVAKDEVEAAMWYRKAAEQGHATAQYNLCVCV